MLCRWEAERRGRSGPSRLQQVCGCATEFLALLDWVSLSHESKTKFLEQRLGEGEAALERKKPSKGKYVLPMEANSFYLFCSNLEIT